MISRDKQLKLSKTIKQNQQQQWKSYKPYAPMGNDDNICESASWLVWRLGTVIPTNHMHLTIAGLVKAATAAKWQQLQQPKTLQSHLQHSNRRLYSCKWFRMRSKDRLLIFSKIIQQKQPQQWNRAYLMRHWSERGCCSEYLGCSYRQNI